MEKYYYFLVEVRFQSYNWKLCPYALVLKAETLKQATQKAKEVAFGWNEEIERLSLLQNCPQDGFEGEQAAYCAAFHHCQSMQEVASA